MKILIELPTWLGDTVMATPALENLIAHFSHSEIHLIGARAPIELLENHPKISSFIVTKKSYLYLYRTAKKLGRFDLYFSFRQSFRSKFLKLCVLSRKKYQFNKDRYFKIHQVEKYNNFINDSIMQNYLPGKLIIHKSNNLDIRKSKHILGINPGASYGSSKRWSPEKFAEVALKYSSQFEIVIFGSQNEIDIAFDIESILANRGVLNYQNLSGKTSISELLDHISKLDIFVTGDSGPMHTRHEETSQWMNKNSHLVKKNLSCQPCMKRKCPLGHNNCMKMIETKEIFDLVDSIN